MNFNEIYSFVTKIVSIIYPTFHQFVNCKIEKTTRQLLQLNHYGSIQKAVRGICFQNDNLT